MNKTCFVISPIGEDGSDVRKRADKVLCYLIRPVCDELGYETSRADEICEPGLISRRIIREIITSDLVIADLTGHNPNVFYELAIRHFVGKPFVQIIEKSDSLPFDVYDLNTIKISHNDIDSMMCAKDKLKKLINSSVASGFIDTAVTAVLSSLNIPVPAKQENISTEDQLSTLIKSIISELDQSKKERSMLIEKILGSDDVGLTENVHAFSLKNDGHVGGIWNSNTGLVKLKQDGNDVVGEYQYESDNWCGDIIGRIVDGLIIFNWRWKNGSFKGFGYWKESGNHLSGGWLYDYQCDLTFRKLLNNPRVINSLNIPKSQRWLLFRE